MAYQVRVISRIRRRKVACDEPLKNPYSGSASAKLARFVLDLTGERGQASSKGDEQTRVKLTLTHEEIAEVIGASRETVTRPFADFKKKQLVKFQGSSLVIIDKPDPDRISGF